MPYNLLPMPYTLLPMPCPALPCTLLLPHMLLLLPYTILLMLPMALLPVLFILFPAQGRATEFCPCSRHGLAAWLACHVPLPGRLLPFDSPPPPHSLLQAAGSIPRTSVAIFHLDILHLIDLPWTGPLRGFCNLRG